MRLGSQGHPLCLQRWLLPLVPIQAPGFSPMGRELKCRTPQQKALSLPAAGLNTLDPTPHIQHMCVWVCSRGLHLKLHFLIISCN